MSREPINTYTELVRITSEYLGPAGQRFVDRHIENHLKKSPPEISAKDIDGLTKWIEASMFLLTNDQMLIEEYIDRISELENTSKERVPNTQ